MTAPLNILLLCNRSLVKTNVQNHIDAFTKHSQHRVWCFSHLGDLPDALDLHLFDVVVIHYTLFCLGERYLSNQAKQRIKGFGGLKVQFIQDEYRRVHEVTDQVRELGVDVLFTAINPESIEEVYPQERLPGVRKVPCLTGYVPEHLLGLQLPKISERKIDVGYRSRKGPHWMGRGGLEKWQIADGFLQHARGAKLALDISYDENKRIYGRRWGEFMRSCRAMLGVEGGSSVIDFTGELQKAVDAFVKERPEASATEVCERFLKGVDGKIFNQKISPRCFECACSKTAMVLFEGKYSGVLEPWRHYVPLKKDFSNFDEVLRAIRDHELLQGMVERTYKEVALAPQWSYKGFVRGVFDKVVVEEFAARGKTAVGSGYRRWQWCYLWWRSVATQRLRRLGVVALRAIREQQSLSSASRHEEW